MSDKAATVWGVDLRGHVFDLKDWEENLRAPFDPWVERLQEEYVLHSSEFDGLESFEEVQARAHALVDQLNGAMAVAGTRRISPGGIIRFNPDGTHHRHLLAETGVFEVRGRLVRTVWSFAETAPLYPRTMPASNQVKFSAGP